MKRVTLTASVAAAALVCAALAYGAVKPQSKSHQFTCKDRNTSLSFVVSEWNGKVSQGFMYVENMQVANLTAEMGGRSMIKVSVLGNSAENVAFQLHMSNGNVMIANSGDNPTRVEVCKANYRVVE